MNHDIRVLIQSLQRGTPPTTVSAPGRHGVLTSGPIRYRDGTVKEPTTSDDRERLRVKPNFRPGTPIEERLHPTTFHRGRHPTQEEVADLGRLSIWPRDDNAPGIPVEVLAVDILTARILQSVQLCQDILSGPAPESILFAIATRFYAGDRRRTENKLQRFLTPETGKRNMLLRDRQKRRVIVHPRLPILCVQVFPTTTEKQLEIRSLTTEEALALLRRLPP